MLYLRRRKGEKIIIEGLSGETITLEIRNMENDFVQLGFEASKEIKIDREEIYKAKHNSP